MFLRFGSLVNLSTVVPHRRLTILFKAFSQKGWLLWTSPKTNLFNHTTQTFQAINLDGANGLQPNTRVSMSRIMGYNQFTWNGAYPVHFPCPCCCIRVTGYLPRPHRLHWQHTHGVSQQRDTWLPWQGGRKDGAHATLQLRQRQVLGKLRCCALTFCIGSCIPDAAATLIGHR